MSDEITIPRELWRAAWCCEIHCVAGCCGENAFDLDPVQMQYWVREATQDDIAAALRQADELIEQLTRLGPSARLRDFSGDDPNGPRAWVEELRECIVEATNPPPAMPDGRPVVRRVLTRLRVLAKVEVEYGDGFPPVPLESGPITLFLPDGRLPAEATLHDNPLDPGRTSLAELRFPLPRRAQPFLTVGGTLDLDRSRGRKTVEATILQLIL